MLASLRQSRFPTAVTDPEVRRFESQGYLAYEGLLNPQEVAEATQALSQVIQAAHTEALRGDQDIRVEAGDSARSNYAGYSLKSVSGSFLLRFQAGTTPMEMPTAEAELLVRVLYGFCRQHPMFQKVVAHPRIMAVVESLVGSGALLFQDMAMIKPRRIGSEKPWHQDDAYFSYAPLDQIVGVWIALDDTTVANGCMHVLPGDHLRGGLKHYNSAVDCEIVPDRLEKDRAVPIELAAGGVLFFSGLLPHQTPPNTSDRRRRALQFHYRGAATQQLDKLSYDAVYQDPDGTPASCKAAAD